LTRGDVFAAGGELAELERLVREALREDLARKAEARKQQEQQQIHDLMTRNVEVVRNVTLRPGRAAQLLADKSLDSGQHFKDVLAALARCETDRSGPNAQALIDQCHRYLRHVDRMSRA